jgi:metal-sulfur cluster biosynthetic enzyme
MNNAKENANPTVLAVADTNKNKRRNLALEYPAISAISAGNNTPWRSLADRAVLHALVDAAAASKGSVSLLRTVGLVIPDDPLQIAAAFRTPLFVPSRIPVQTNAAAAAAAAAAKEQSSSSQRDPIDADEIFEIIRNIQDPEHPLTLEQLAVVSRSQIEINVRGQQTCVTVRFTPTIPHCSMATLIGLTLTVKLVRSFGGTQRFQVLVEIEPGTHQSELSVNKQLADKERVCAALENKHLAGVVNRCIGNGMTGNLSVAV